MMIKPDNIHFVYSVPAYWEMNIYKSIKKKVTNKLFEKHLVNKVVNDRHPKAKDFENWPKQSPFENTKNIYIELSRRSKTKLYHITERVSIKFGHNDIFLGHPYFPYRGVEQGVTEKAVESKLRPRTFALISPLHCNTDISFNHINKIYLDHVGKLLEKSDLLFAIMGEYWWSKWDSSTLSKWKNKMVRVDMAIDCDYYPLVKDRFNQKGKRKFLYIGNNNPLKGTSFLTELALLHGKEKFGWIGSGPEICHIQRISKNRPLTPDFMRQIASEYDFFISTSLADANPTTILETMAWGFPVVCTPQSGYYETDFRFSIDASNISKSMKTLNQLQNLTDEELFAISAKARSIVLSDYTWNKFNSIIASGLKI